MIKNPKSQSPPPKRFFNLLTERVRAAASLLCVGLDPHPSDLPAPTAEAALDYCLRLIKATARYAAAYKPNAAFFEVFGPEGWTALKMVVEAVAEESHRTGSVIPVILDAKRGDISSTAEAYAQAAFARLGAHAITLSPYLGHDSVAPFLVNCEKGVFLLCKTSNPGASDLQDVALADGAFLYEHVAQLAQAWNTSGNVGLVVGATQPEALARVRAIAPQAWILAPGVGAQGGDLEQALSAGLRADGLGMLIPVSRGLSRAKDPAKAAAELRDSIFEIRHSILKNRPPAEAFSHMPTLAADLLEAGCIQFGEFTLTSGKKSPVYLDLRRLVSHPAILRRVAHAYATTLRSRDLKIDRLAGIPYAALPIATAVALEMKRPLIYPRREAKEHGMRASIEGEFAPGETAVVLDDVATTGGTKFDVIRKLETAGLKVRDIVVLIDREEGAREALAAAGYTLHAVVTLRQLLEELRRTGAITQAQHDEALASLTLAHSRA